MANAEDIRRDLPDYTVHTHKDGGVTLIKFCKKQSKFLCIPFITIGYFEIPYIKEIVNKVWREYCA